MDSKTNDLEVIAKYRYDRSIESVKTSSTNEAHIKIEQSIHTTTHTNKDTFVGRKCDKQHEFTVMSQYKQELIQ